MFTAMIAIRGSDAASVVVDIYVLDEPSRQQLGGSERVEGEDGEDDSGGADEAHGFSGH